jgi:hypothetical protein
MVSAKSAPLEGSSSGKSGAPSRPRAEETAGHAQKLGGSQPGVVLGNFAQLSESPTGPDEDPSKGSKRAIVRATPKLAVDIRAMDDAIRKLFYAKGSVTRNG